VRKNREEKESKDAKGDDDDGDEEESDEDNNPVTPPRKEPTVLGTTMTPQGRRSGRIMHRKKD